MAHMILTRIEPLSYAKIAGAIAGLLGLVIGVLYAFGTIAFSSMLGGESIGVALGFGMAILFPVLYGGLAFVFGFLSAWMYNAIAARVGGIEMEFEDY